MSIQSYKQSKVLNYYNNIMRPHKLNIENVSRKEYDDDIIKMIEQEQNCQEDSEDSSYPWLYL